MVPTPPPRPVPSPQPVPKQNTGPSFALALTIAWIMIVGVPWFFVFGLLVMSWAPNDKPWLFVAHMVYPAALMPAAGLLILGWKRRNNWWFLGAAVIATLGAVAGIGSLILDDRINY